MTDPTGDLGIDRCTALLQLFAIPAVGIVLLVLILAYVIGYKHGRRT